MSEITRSSPSGPRVIVADSPFSVRQRVLANIPLLETLTPIFSDFVPLPADAPAAGRIALVVVTLALVNGAGFDGAPIVGNVALTRNAQTPINLGNYRCAPVGPGLVGPFQWTCSLELAVAPGDQFDLSASSRDGNGGVGGAAVVTSYPAPADPASSLLFLFV